MKRFLRLTTGFLLTAWVISHSQVYAQTWTQVSDFPNFDRGGMCSFSYQGKGYIGMGLTSSNTVMGDFWEYNGATDSWTQKANIPQIRYSGKGFVIGNKGFITCGSKSVTNLTSNLLNDLWEYDFALDTWTQKAAFPGTNRYNLFSFVLNGKAYVGGGYSPTFENDFWEYDPALDTWTQLNDFQGVGRTSASAFALNGKGYVGLGYDGGNLNDFWQYNPANDSWVQKNNFPGTARFAAGGLSNTSRGYIAGGTDGTSFFNDFNQYNDTTDSWLVMPALGTGLRASMVNFVIGNVLYVGLGIDQNNNYHHDLWKFQTFTVSNSGEIGAERAYSLYPNPSTGKFNISLPNHPGGSGQLRVRNSLSQLMFSETLRFQPGLESYSIDISTFPKGIYFIELETETEKSSSKMVVN